MSFKINVKKYIVQWVITAPFIFQVFHYITKVNFTTKNGERVLFDKLGDPVARYALVNWQKNTEETIIFKTIGLYDASQQDGQEFLMNDVTAVWTGDQHTVSRTLQMTILT